MSLAATPGGFFQLLSKPLTCYYIFNEIGGKIKNQLKSKQRKPVNNSFEYDQEMKTRVSANSSTLPNDSILVKSGPTPVITTLTEAAYR